MPEAKRYKQKASNFVTAVQLDLDTPGFTYNKWGGEQKCKQGDWLVKNHFDGETYTVDAESFEQTYSKKSPGVYLKDAPVWATEVVRSGTIATKEGETAVEPGDYRVSNNEDGTDSYAISQETFHDRYELDG